jgi:serine/threonine protein kinase
MRLIANICRKIGSELGQYSSIDKSSRSRLKREVQEALGNDIKLGEEAGAGDFSIVYFGTKVLDNHDLVVKAVVTSPLDDWDLKSLGEHLKTARNLTHPSFIRTHDAKLEHKPPIMTMDRIDGPTLKDVLRVEGAMPPIRVAGILHQIAAALSNAHQLGLVYGSLRSSNLFLLKGDLLKLPLQRGHTLRRSPWVGRSELRDAELYDTRTLLCQFCLQEK